jgi:hypothetical protein
MRSTNVSGFVITIEVMKHAFGGRITVNWYDPHEDVPDGAIHFSGTLLCYVRAWLFHPKSQMRYGPGGRQCTTFDR